MNGILRTSIIALCLSCSASNARILYDQENCAACRLTTATVLSNLGYPTESHFVVTPDGYVLEIFRVVHGTRHKRQTHGVPIIAQHGANSNSDSWVLTYERGNDRSLVTELVDRGFDLWVTNVRGGRYARHTTYQPTQFQYWNYTLDEMSLIDLKGIVDYVLETTRYPSLAYMGHSLGGLFFSMLLSDMPEYNSKIHYALLLAPVLYSARNKHFLMNFFAGHKPFDRFKLAYYEYLVDNGMKNTFFDKTVAKARESAKECEKSQLHRKICSIKYGFKVGLDPNTFPTKEFELFFDDSGEGYAVKHVTHLAQLGLADKVQKYDYGSRNRIVYGTPSPPEYHLNKIEIPISIYYGRNDYLLDVADCQRYINELSNTNVTAHLMQDSRFNHYDYFYGSSRQPFIDMASHDMERFHKNHKYYSNRARA